MLNNFGEIAVRVLERHIKLAPRLAHARRVAAQTSEEAITYLSPALPEPVRQLECRLLGGENVEASRSPSGDQGAVVPVKEGGWAQQVQGAGPMAEAAAVAAACKSYGAWWGDDSSTSSAAAAAAAAAVTAAREGGAAGPGAGEQAALGRDLLLCRAFKQELRSTERVADACVLLIDTGHPSWPVLYADETWKEWAGAWVKAAQYIVGGVLHAERAEKTLFSVQTFKSRIEREMLPAGPAAPCTPSVCLLQPHLPGAFCQAALEHASYCMQG